MGLNHYKAILKKLELAFGLQIQSEVLESLEASIQSAEREASRIANSNRDPDHIELLLDEKSAVVEDLIGCGFVASQTYITQVCDDIAYLHEYAKRDNKILTVTGSKKARDYRLRARNHTAGATCRRSCYKFLC